MISLENVKQILQRGRLIAKRDKATGRVVTLDQMPHPTTKGKTTNRVAAHGEQVQVMSRKSGHKVRSTRLIVTEDGTPMTVAMLRRRFDLAREAAGVKKPEFQMRDLRAKAGTDKAESSGDIMQAKDQLGHTSVVMTEQYIRNRKGKKVSPTK